MQDILSGTSSALPDNLVNFGGTLFFVANDGTTPGIVLVQDILSGSGSSSTSELTNVNGTLFFVADDGSVGTEPWKAGPAHTKLFVR